VEVGRRVGLHLQKMLLDAPGSPRVVQGPAATAATARPAGARPGTFTVSVTFRGGSADRGRRCRSVISHRLPLTFVA
jgi:hypothetical protein